MQPKKFRILSAITAGTLALTAAAGHDGTIAVMQADDNFVLRAPGNIPIWASGTDGHPGTVVQVQDDGGVVLYARAIRSCASFSRPSSTPK